MKFFLWIFKQINLRILSIRLEWRCKKLTTKLLELDRMKVDAVKNGHKGIENGVSSIMRQILPEIQDNEIRMAAIDRVLGRKTRHDLKRRIFR